MPTITTLYLLGVVAFWIAIIFTVIAELQKGNRKIMGMSPAVCVVTSIFIAALWPLVVIELVRVIRGKR